MEIGIFCLHLLVFRLAVAHPMHILDQKKMIDAVDHQVSNIRRGCFVFVNGGCMCEELNTEDYPITVLYNDLERCRVGTGEPRSVEMYALILTEELANATAIPSSHEFHTDKSYEYGVSSLKLQVVGMKELCLPKVRGCVCVVEWTKRGHPVTERRIWNKDCLCEKGDGTPGCPVELHIS